MTEDEFNANADRREVLVQRACALMGWEYSTGYIWAGMRKAALGEAVIISLDKLEELLNELEKARSALSAALDTIPSE